MVWTSVRLGQSKSRHGLLRHDSRQAAWTWGPDRVMAKRSPPARPAPRKCRETVAASMAALTVRASQRLGGTQTVSIPATWRHNERDGPCWPLLFAGLGLTALSATAATIKAGGKGNDVTLNTAGARIGDLRFRASPPGSFGRPGVVGLQLQWKHISDSDPDRRGIDTHLCRWQIRYFGRL